MANVGDFALIRYNVGGRAVRHERLILCVGVGGVFGIWTPDDDYYEENSTLGPNVREWYVLPTQGTVPAGVSPASILCFRGMPPQSALDLAAFSCCMRLGLPAPTGHVVPNLPPTMPRPLGAPDAAPIVPVVRHLCLLLWRIWSG